MSTLPRLEQAVHDEASIYTASLGGQDRAWLLGNYIDHFFWPPENGVRDDWEWGGAENIQNRLTDNTEQEILDILGLDAVPEGGWEAYNPSLEELAPAIWSHVETMWTAEQEEGGAIWEYEQALQAAEESGTVVINSAGNGQLNLPHHYLEALRLIDSSSAFITAAIEPYNPETLINTGSYTVDRDLNLENNSLTTLYGVPYTLGQHIDIIAPGGNILVNSGFPDGFNPEMVDGTSFSAPYVAGTVAYMQAANPNLTPSAIRQLLYETAIDTEYLETEEGNGMLDPVAAVRAAQYLNTLYPDTVIFSKEQLLQAMEEGRRFSDALR